MSSAILHGPGGAVQPPARRALAALVLAAALGSAGPALAAAACAGIAPGADRPVRNLAYLAPTEGLPAGAHRLDLWPGASPLPAPLVVFVHGGTWMHGGKYAGTPRQARAFRGAGYAYATVNYRLRRHGPPQEAARDIAEDVAFLRREAKACGLDPERIVLMGHSAGAYNAVMLGLDQRWLSAQGLSSNALRGVVGLAGPYDFYPFESEATKLSFGKAPNSEETQPVVHARAGGPPLLLVHGAADTRVRPRNSVELARTMTRAGAPTHAVLLEGVTHEGIIMLFARPFSHDPRALDAVLPFLAKVTASPAVKAQGG
jgi:acetyl esterase/lipase